MSPGGASTFVIAKDKGYYRGEGLDVELIVTPAAVATQALIGGNVPFISTGGAALPPLLRGAPMKFLFTTFYRPMYWLYAKPELRSLNDLKGKRVGVSSLGSGPDSLLRHVLRKNGLEGGRDVIIMAMGAGTARFFALQADSVDAAVLGIPGNLMAEDAGFRELLSFMTQEAVEFQGSIVVREALLQANPGLIEKFLRGSLKGLLYLRNNRPGAIKILSRFMKLDEERTARVYDSVRTGMSRDGTVDVELQKKSLEHILERTGTKEPPPLEKIFNYSLTSKIYRELQAKGWKAE